MFNFVAKLKGLGKVSFHCFADVVNPDVSDTRTQAEDRQDRARDGSSRLVNRIN